MKVDHSERVLYKTLGLRKLIPQPTKLSYTPFQRAWRGRGHSRIKFTIVYFALLMSVDCIKLCIHVF